MSGGRVYHARWMSKLGYDFKDWLRGRRSRGLRCACCGHSATLPARVADLAGQKLRCTRQRLDSAQVIEAAYREEWATAEGGTLH